MKIKYFILAFICCALSGCGVTSEIAVDSSHNYISTTSVYLSETDVKASTYTTTVVTLANSGYVKQENETIDNVLYEKWTNTSTVSSRDERYTFISYDGKRAYFNLSEKCDKTFINSMIPDTQSYFEWKRVYVTVPEQILYTNGVKDSKINGVLFDDSITDDRGYLVFDTDTYNNNQIIWSGIADNKEYKNNRTVTIKTVNAIKSFRVNGNPQAEDSYTTETDGTYVVEVTLANGYKETKTFTVNTIEKPKPETLSKYVLNIGDRATKVAVVNIEGDITYSIGNTKIATVNKFGKLKAKGIGHTTLTITGSNGSIKTDIYVLPKAVDVKTVKSTGRKITVKYTTTQEWDRLQLQLFTNKKCTKGKKQYIIKELSFDNLTTDNLKMNTKYYVRMRGIKTINGKTIYSKWTKIKSTKTKR